MSPFIVRERKILSIVILIVLCSILLAALLFLIQRFSPAFNLFGISTASGDIFKVFNVRSLRGLLFVGVFIILGILGLIFGIYIIGKKTFSKDSTFIILDENGIHHKEFKLFIPWQEIDSIQKVGKVILIQVKDYNKLTNDLSPFTKRILKTNSDYFDKQMPGDKIFISLQLLVHTVSTEVLYQEIKKRMKNKSQAFSSSLTPKITP